MPFADENNLVEKAKTDNSAFGQLYEYYFPKVYAFVSAKVRDKAVAEDLVSESFMKILINLKKWQWRGVPFSAWVFRIVRNVLNDYYKEYAEKKTVDIEEIIPVKDESLEGHPKEKTMKNELSGQVKKVLKTLSEKEAEIVHLKFYSELNNREIAKTLNLTESNVGVILYRTLTKIKPDLVNII